MKNTEWVSGVGKGINISQIQDRHLDSVVLEEYTMVDRINRGVIAVNLRPRRRVYPGRRVERIRRMIMGKDVDVSLCRTYTCHES